MKFEEITLEEAKEKYKWIWKAFKAQFPQGKDHEMIRKMVEVVVAIQKGHIRNEDLDE